MIDRAVPIFVVGCYRSGTTMVERMLLSHPRITGPGFETQAFSRLFLGCNPDHVQEHEEYASSVTPGSLASTFETFERALRSDVERTRATHWVEKTPDHVFHVDEIMRHYPQARFVHVLRDGRDVVTSFLGFPSLVPHARTRASRLAAGCALWEWMVLQGLRAQSRAVSERFVTVRYEEVVRAPERSLRWLLDWAGVPDVHDDVATTERGLLSLAGNSSYEPYASGVYASAVGRWTDGANLSEAERALIESLIGPTLALAGYAPGLPRAVPEAARLRSSVAKLFWLGVRLARFRANVGYWPPPHLSDVARHAVRPLLAANGREAVG